MPFGATNYPGSLDDAASLGSLVNNCATTLASSYTAGGTSLTVTDGSAFPTTGGAIFVGGERTVYSSRSGNTLTITALSNNYLAGAAVELRYDAANHNVLRSAIVALQTRVGVTGDTGAGTLTKRIADLESPTVTDSVSAAGSTQGTATALTTDSRVTTVGSGEGVRLDAPGVGKRRYVFNAGANALKIYPPTGGQINTLGTNNPDVLQPGEAGTYQQFSSTQFQSVEPLPLSDNNPVALGSASAGSGASAARHDHVHPTTGLLLTSNLSSSTPSGHGASGAAGSSGNVSRADHVHQRQLESFVIAVGDESTAISTGTAKVTFRMPYAFTLTAARASLNTVSSSGIVTVDVNEAGSSIFGTNKLTIDASEKTSVTAATAVDLSDTALADDAEITIDIDAAGTGAKGLKVVLIGRQSAA